MKFYSTDCINYIDQKLKKKRFWVNFFIVPNTNSKLFLIHFEIVSCSSCTIVDLYWWVQLKVNEKKNFEGYIRYNENNAFIAPDTILEFLGSIPCI